MYTFHQNPTFPASVLRRHNRMEPGKTRTFGQASTGVSLTIGIIPENSSDNELTSGCTLDANRINHVMDMCQANALDVVSEFNPD